MSQMEKGIFTYASLKLILADCVGFWESKHSEGGRWLSDYEEKNPEKASIIEKILLDDMKFIEESSQIEERDYIKYLAAGGSAAAGLLISRYTGASNWVQTVCTIAPAVVAYPIVSNVISTLSDKQKKVLIQNYMDQLEKYKVSIQRILEDE